MAFVPLHNKSHYSFLEALPKVNDLVRAAKEDGVRALALTDNGNLHGAIEFYKACKKADMTPIIGVEVQLASKTRHESDAHDTPLGRIVLLAKNNDGYKNLMALVSKTFTEGYDGRPRADKELLHTYKEGVIALLHGRASDVGMLLEGRSDESAEALLHTYKDIYGDHLYIEITKHPELPGHDETMTRALALSKKIGIRAIAAHETHYLKSEDREAREVMGRIQGGSYPSPYQSASFPFLTTKEMEEAFADTPELLEETVRIADMIDVSLSLGTWNFPDFKIPQGTTFESELRRKTNEGIVTRGFSETPELRTRIEYELSVIIDKGFAPYFLVVSDLLDFAKQEGILTTTRGSAAGSLVSYLVGITNVDPIFYKLPFERFLNPERPKAPDIDMDFADNRRDEVIAYARKKYGDDHVAQIGTFGTMLARAAVRDIARALGHSYATGDRIAKLIPQGSQGFPMTIDRALDMEPDLKELYDNDEDVAEIINLARKIEGSARHTGVHAAGVVISPTPLVEWTPIQFDPKGGKLITQYDMHSVEEAGLLKFDFLGIKNLAILADSVRRVKAHNGTDIDIENVPVDDEKTFAMLARGETEGTFQLNGSGMTRYLKELRPTTIHDINAMVALYRPGPMETIPQYIERKRDPSLIHYLDERMKEYLDASYGLLVYQDDVLLTAIKLGGYSWLEADTLRKAMGKKIPAEMEAQKEKLLKGFVEYGKLSPEKAGRIWKLIEPFAAYGFNKAHAASYGKVAYQTSYMKANHPVQYMAAVLTADAGDTDSIAIFVAECGRLGIPVLPPDVNESGSVFTDAENNAIRFGLSSIKNFGTGIAEAILEERTKNGPFASLAEFLTRIQNRNLNRKSLESLAKCGALDRFAERATILGNIEHLLDFHREVAHDSSTQDSLFGAEVAPHTLTLTEMTPSTLLEKLDWERELLGIYVSGHPLDAYSERLKNKEQALQKFLSDGRNGLPVVAPVLVEEVKTILTKGGDKMAFVRIADRETTVESVLFPRLFKEKGALFTPGTCIIIKGKMSSRNGETSILIEDAKPL